MEKGPRGRDLPERVGRYEVFARLETGGMAEILLGRVTGPSGFERPVVIKRMLPHLAEDPRFVEMFLDEARIVAGIRHPNVIHVQDLASENEDLFLVLEYLEGETTASLLRRLKARAQIVPPAIGAHIAAEACAGLHAAHELTSATGEPQNVVHRDVSPSNIFITFEGAVKVLDFGIAKAADRIASTEAGEIKGKFAYMSPEQARGLDLDRRSDIYSLGLVLYELTTGQNPLRRATDVGTYQAALSEPVAPPSRIVPSYPAALEAICLRALAQDREARYATAAEMRQDLLAVVRAGGDEAPSETLARTMREVFADQIAARRDLLRRMATGAGGAASAGAGSRPTAGTGSGARRRESSNEASQEPTSVPTTFEGRGRRRNRRLVVGVALLLAGAGAAAMGVRLSRQHASGAAPEANCGAAVQVANLRADWTTPNGIQLSWDASGTAADLLRFELVIGKDGPAVSARALSAGAPAESIRVVGEAENPELGRFQRPRTQGLEPVRSTIIDGLVPDTIYHARLAAIDTRQCRSTTALVTTRTAVEPIGEAVLFHDDPPREAGALDGYVVATDGRHHAGSSAHLEYGSFCPVGQPACWRNLRLVVNKPLALNPGPFSQAFVELAISCSGSGAIFWTEIITCFGLECRALCDPACSPECTPRCEDARMFDFAPFSVACGPGGGYRVVQVPLRALTARPSYHCRPRIPCALTAAHIAATHSLQRLSIGGMWPRGAIVRVDEVRIRW